MLLLLRLVWILSPTRLGRKFSGHPVCRDLVSDLHLLGDAGIGFIDHANLDVVGFHCGESGADNSPNSFNLRTRIHLCREYNSSSTKPRTRLCRFGGSLLTANKSRYTLPSGAGAMDCFFNPNKSSGLTFSTLIN